MSSNNFYLILLASGVGKRAGLKNKMPKQLWSIKNKPLLWYSLNSFRKIFEDSKIIITYPKGFKKYFLNFLDRYNLTIPLVEGGLRRQDSVKNAFSLISHKKGYVLIHDSARPLVSLNLIKKVMEYTKKYKAVIPVIQPCDTVKIIENNKVKETIDRNKVGLVQTPQGFSINILKKAYETINFDKEYTDEASMVEQLGKKITTIPGERTNFKLTFQHDLAIIKSLLRECYEY
jgi:2-C-methyl-D-erythritol 4-phosphate cytidylyltransferase